MPNSFRSGATVKFSHNDEDVKNNNNNTSNPPPEHEDESYFSVTYTQLFKAHILDVHLPNVLMGISASVEVPLVTILGRRIGANYATISDFITLSALSRTVFDIPFGIIVEYVGVRNVMFACLAVNVAASIVGFHIASELTLAIFCVLSGVSLGGFFLSRHIFVAGISSKKYRGLLMAILSGLLRWSHVIGPVASGLAAAYLGDVRYSFVFAAITSTAAFISLLIAVSSSSYQEQCIRSCTTSAKSSAFPTPAQSDVEEEQDEEELDQHQSTPLVRHAPTPTHAVIVGAEVNPAEKSHTSTTSTAFYASQQHAQQHAREALVAQQHMHLHPSLSRGTRHHFRLSTLWYTIVDYWTIIWRLGFYIVAFTALRANRKLLITFAGMEAKMSDAQVSYLLGFGFIFDAILFPLGGLTMDLLGRQYAMVPVALGLSFAFLMLPFCKSERMLYVASGTFGLADALGCGLIMTITADRAPTTYGAPFFGIMRTLQDFGHVVGARGVSFLFNRYGFAPCCFVMATAGVVVAVWGVWGVPREEEGDGKESSALREAAEQPLLAAEGSASTRSSSMGSSTGYGTTESRPLH